MAPPIKFSPLIFKEIAREILFELEDEEETVSENDKFAIYSLAIYLRDSAANAILHVINKAKSELKRFQSIIGEHQFVEWWYTQIKFWDIKHTSKNEYPTPLPINEIVSLYPKYKIEDSCSKFVIGIKTHVYNTYKRHVCSKYDDDTFWLKFLNNNF